MIFRYPTNYIAITNLYKKGSHWGLDLGWTSKIKEYGPHQPIYASADGVVYVTHDKDRTGKSWGNYIKIKHDNNTYTLYAHLEEGSLKVRKNDKVKQGQHIATMGKTGGTKAYHLHFEIYEGGANTKYRVDPLPLTYAFPDQTVCEPDKDVVKYYTPTTEPVERDETRDQLEVTKNKLRIRTKPNLQADILGYADLGYYNDLETFDADGYTWHKVADNNWLAEINGYVRLLPRFNVGDIVTLKEPITKYKITNIEDNEVSIIPITDVNNIIKD